MRQLLWKEWHEQAWKLAFGCIVLSAMAAIGLRARMVPDLAMVAWVCGLGLTLLPVLASTGLVPAERAEGTLESLLAMPIAAWRILLAKTAVGLLLGVGPLVVAGTVSLLMAGGREVYAGQIVALFGRSALAGAALFVWMQAATIRLPSEARAALLAVGVLILWGLASAGLALSHEHTVVFAATPFALVYQLPADLPDTLGGGPPLVVTVAVQTVLSAAVWLLALRLFRAGGASS